MLVRFYDERLDSFFDFGIVILASLDEVLGVMSPVLRLVRDRYGDPLL